MNKTIAALVFILSISTGSVTGCASHEKKVTTPPETSEVLFPSGNYVHEVRVYIPNNPDSTKRNLQFRGVVKIAPDVIRIVALSPVGSTLFKMSEERASAKVTIETFVSSLKSHEPKLLEYYAALRILLTAARHPRPTTFEQMVNGEPTRFDFEAYDEHGIPTTLRVRNPQFTVEVRVVGYEF